MFTPKRRTYMINVSNVAHMNMNNNVTFWGRFIIMWHGGVEDLTRHHGMNIYIYIESDMSRAIMWSFAKKWKESGGDIWGQPNRTQKQEMRVSICKLCYVICVRTLTLASKAKAKIVLICFPMVLQ